MISEPFGRFLPSLLTAKIGNPPLRFLPAWERWWRLTRTTPLISATTPAFAGFNHRLSANNATLGTFLVPASFYALGWVRKDSYSTHTSLLAAEAVADCEITAWVLKNATGRERPNAVPTGGNYSDTWFEHYQPPLLREESFPSGHAIAAFSVATVFQRLYGNHRWVPWVAYGAATAVGFSRITLQAHFPSDVFAGAVFGYVISRFVVLHGRDTGY